MLTRADAFRERRRGGASAPRWAPSLRQHHDARPQPRRSSAGAETRGSELLHGPAARTGRPVVRRRLGDDQSSRPPARNPTAALGDHRRRAERPRDHEVEGVPQREVPGERSSARPQRTSTRSARSESLDRLGEEVAAALARRRAGRRAVGPVRARTRPGTPPPEPRSRKRRRRIGRSGGASAWACSTWASTGPGPRNPRSRPSSSTAGSGAGGHGRVGLRVVGRMPGRMITRRRGSSPSDSVTTPSISAAVSCTTLRSAADIGSSAWARPLSSDLLHERSG